MHDLREAVLCSQFAGKKLCFGAAEAHLCRGWARGVGQGGVNQRAGRLLTFWLIARRLIFRRLRGEEWSGRKESGRSIIDLSDGLRTSDSLQYNFLVARFMSLAVLPAGLVAGAIRAGVRARDDGPDSTPN